MDGNKNPKDYSDICAIITTYRAEFCIVECVEKIIKQVAEVIIVDDGDSEHNVIKLKRWFGGNSKVTLWHQPTNSGIAAALNAGIKIVQKKGYEWVVTLDDDSIPDNDMVQKLCENLARIIGSQPIGIIGMKPASNHCMKSLPSQRCVSPPCLDKRGIITSGSLFSLSTFAEVGPFREEFFIDSVDYDFCMRARAKGFRVIQIQEYGFKHSLGQNEVFKFGPLIVNSISHTPARLSSTFRNSTILAKEYFWKDTPFSCAVLLSQFRIIMRIIFFQKNKTKKIYAIFLGLVAFFNHEMGKINTSIK